MEIWKDIKGFEGKYQVSNMGNVRSIFRSEPKNMKGSVNEKGYRFVELLKNGKRTKMRIGRAVAIAFIDNPDNKPEVNHINEIRNDDRVENLEWMTRLEQVNHGNYKENMRKTLNEIIDRGDHYKAKSIVRICLETGEKLIYPSINRARKDGFYDTPINKCLEDPSKSYKGFYWRYNKVN